MKKYRIKFNEGCDYVFISADTMVEALKKLIESDTISKYDEFIGIEEWYN